VIGRRRVLPTIAETIGIAAAAAIASSGRRGSGHLTMGRPIITAILRGAW
jgi:hypothetical protein